MEPSSDSVARAARRPQIRLSLFVSPPVSLPIFSSLFLALSLSLSVCVVCVCMCVIFFV